jgi:hypothetical protein
MKDRFDELLPWYVNGSLGAEDREWVDRYLSEHPEARPELDWARSLSTRLRDSMPAVAPTIGLERTMERIRGKRPTLAERMGAFLDSLGMRPAAALAGLAIVAVQGGFILHLLDSAGEDATEMRSLRAVASDERPMLKLNFAPDAKEAAIRHLLVSVQGRLAGGPGQLGDYYVIVPAGQEAAIAERLKTEPIVQAVSLAPGLPPRE